MKLSLLFGGAATFLLCTISNGGQLTVFIDGFAEPTNLTNPDLSWRVTPLVSPQSNSSTHILIEGLSPVEEDGTEYASTYTGIDVNTGAAQDTGVLYINMPTGSQLPAGTVASPIVGVVSRPGGWDNSNLQFPLTDISAITGETPGGTGLYDGSVLNLNLTNGSSEFTGSVNYSVMDENTLVLSPFTLTKDGSSTIDMSESVLFRDGNRFYGVLTNLSYAEIQNLDVKYNSLIFSIDLDAMPDLDLDSIPDISDPAVLIPSNWSITSVGHLWNAQDSIGYSPFLGWVDLSNYPILYHYEFGWLQVMATPQAPDTVYWLHSPTLGFIYTSSDWNGDFFHLNGQSWVLDNFLNPNR